MKETKFIEKNKQKWSKFEKTYADSKNNPEELSKLYIDITEDLGYAQTFYTHRTVRVYLNQFAQKVFSGVHKQSGGEIWKKLLEILTVALPIEIYKSRKNLLFALISFLIYTLLGAVTTHFDPDFPRIVMGDNYVNMTLENIDKGNPLAVYEGQEQLSMFIQITSNNLKVALLVFFAGAFTTIGTHILLFSNGIMLGSFQYFFQTKGLLITSFLGIWIHGAFEISAIVLAGGAGITAGNGWLFPKSYTRLQSVKISTVRGLKIMLSLIPFIVAAGFLESYVTRNYLSLPEWSKWGIIFFSFALILAYYVIYPFYVARKYPHLVKQEEIIDFQHKTGVVLNKLRTLNEIISDTFKIYWSSSKYFFKIIFTIIFPISVILVYIQGQIHMDRMLVQHWFDWYAQAQIIFGFGMYHFTDLIVGLIWSILFTMTFSAVFWAIKTTEFLMPYKSYFLYLRQRFWKLYLSFALFYWLFFFVPMEFKFILIFILPLITINTAVAGLDDGNNLLKKAFQYGKKAYVSSLVILLFYSLLVTVLIQPIAFVFSIHESWTSEPVIKDLLDLITDFINRTLIMFTDDYMYYSNSFRQLIYLLFTFLTLPLFALLTAFIYFNVLEVDEVVSLKKDFESFGKHKQPKE